MLYLTDKSIVLDSIMFMLSNRHEMHVSYVHMPTATSYLRFFSSFMHKWQSVAVHFGGAYSAIMETQNAPVQWYMFILLLLAASNPGYVV